MELSAYDFTRDEMDVSEPETIERSPAIPLTKSASIDDEAPSDEDESIEDEAQLADGASMNAK